MRQRDTRVYLGLLNDVRERIENGTAMASIASKALEKTANWGLSEIEIAYALSAPWQAGVTTVGSLVSWAMIDHSRWILERLHLWDFHQWVTMNQATEPAIIDLPLAHSGHVTISFHHEEGTWRTRSCCWYWQAAWLRWHGTAPLYPGRHERNA